MNHVVLFLYIVLIAGGTGGVVALALLHTRLRTPITASFLVANSGLLGALLLALISFYIDSILPRSADATLFDRGPVRTILGYVFGAVVYGGLTAAVVRLPAAPRWQTLACGGAVLVAMTVQTVLIVSGAVSLALRLAPVYLVTVSVCLVGFGVIMVRNGGSAPSPTMAWLVTRLGYLTAGFAILSTLLYGVLATVPVLRSLDISFDFLFYAAWCGLSIAAFVRYITRPAPVEESGELSRAFVTAFGITRREEDIVRLIGEGLSNQEIADRLGISFGTVRTYVYNVFQKTGAGSRVDLLRLVGGYRE